jgi:hypothetical protein
MRPAPAALALALLSIACADRAPAPATAPAPAQTAPREGALQILVDPNPIVAIPAGGTTFEFPFTIALRETGGATVTVERVGIDVLSVGGLKVYSTQLGPEDIERRGYRRVLAPHGEVRYSMRPRQQVPDESLFRTLTGELWAEAVDEGGRRITTRTRVTLRKGT